MNDFEVTPAPYGFAWGPAVVERMASDPKWGIVIRIQGVPGEYVDVRVSPKGQKVSVTGPHLRGIDET